ncbi:glycosyltransferase [Microbacterium sp. NPDC087592]|uniref:glycosyltransferase n=1 Tax=Microbacterium sp. NPDC087592 TaxID=3364193 RepID=UPI0037FF87DE
MTRLLLFTNEYPYRTGDVVFVEKEIRELADAFDDVVIFCHARDTSAGLVEMPDNVTIGANLFLPAPEDSPRAILRPHALRMLVAAGWKELTAGRLFRNALAFVLGARIGLTQADRIAVRTAIEGADDVVAYAFWGMGGGQALPWLRGVRRRVARVHGYDLYEERAASGYLPARPYYYAKADRILTISEHGREYLRERFPSLVRTDKVVVSRLGVDGPDDLQRGEREDAVVLVSCSTLSGLKRVPLIGDSVAAFARAAGRPVEWIHFGDGPERAALEARVADAPDNLAVTLAGHTANTDVLRYYDTHRIDAFVNLSTTEGVPVSIMEAIARDIPIVATRVGGTPEIVGEEHGTGRLVELDATAEDVATTLAAVVDAPAGTFAPRARWEAEFDVRSTGARAARLVTGADS